jgi:hypothetical protein
VFFLASFQIVSLTGRTLPAVANETAAMYHTFLARSEAPPLIDESQFAYGEYEPARADPALRFESRIPQGMGGREIVARFQDDDFSLFYERALGRAEIWEMYLTSIRPQNLLFGTGSNTYEQYGAWFRYNRPERYIEISSVITLSHGGINRPHSLYVSMLVSYGVMSLAAFFILVLAIGIYAVGATAFDKQPLPSLWIRALIVFWSVFMLILSVFESNIFYFTLQSIFTWILVSYLQSCDYMPHWLLRLKARAERKLSFMPLINKGNSSGR